MSEYKTKVYPILLAGGSGTRLWPVSRELYPKQLVKFFGEDSLVQSTIKRLSPVMDMENIRIVCGKEHVPEIARHMEDIGVKADGKVIGEPCGRNTAPAILLAMLYVLRKEEDAVLCVFPADHHIRNNDAFHEILSLAIKLAKMEYIVTFGIKPDYPETGYGYIEGAGQIKDQAFFVKRFVEKPDMATAKRYVKAGNFFWNSGMFTFKASVMMEELKNHHPELLKKMNTLSLTDNNIFEKEYQMLPNISIDYAVMEKTDKAVVLPSDFGWSDIGSWKSLYDFMPKDTNGNVIKGDVVSENTQHSLIMGHDRLIATNKIKNLVVVETPDSVFVSDLETSRDVKSIVEKLKEKGRSEYQKHKTSYHLWGTLTVLETAPGFCVARRDMYPGSKCEIKTDASTIKHLIVIKGVAKSTTNNQSQFINAGKSLVLQENETVILENTEDESLIVIAVKANSILADSSTVKVKGQEYER